MCLSFKAVSALENMDPFFVSTILDKLFPILLSGCTRKFIPHSAYAIYALKQCRHKIEVPECDACPKVIPCEIRALLTCTAVRARQLCPQI